MNNTKKSQCTNRTNLDGILQTFRDRKVVLVPEHKIAPYWMLDIKISAVRESDSGRASLFFLVSGEFGSRIPLK